MEAIILAGGFGTRLQSVVSDVPKPMAPVCHKPFLTYLLDDLHQQGCHKVILAVGYKKEVIINHYGNEYKGMDLIYSVEEEPLGTGGCILQAMQYVTEPFVFVLNGDTMFKISYAKMTQLNSIAIACKKMYHFERYGEVKIHNGIIERFEEKKKVEEGYINGGIYYLPKDIFQSFSLPKRFSLEKDFFEKYIQSLSIKAFLSDDYFLDIGIPEDYAQAQIDFRPRKALFLDRDGIINIDYGHVHQIKDFQFTSFIFDLCKKYQNDYLLFIVTNQAGIGKGLYPESDFLELNEYMLKEFQKHDIWIEKVYYCPHSPKDQCQCRKPQPGMFLKAIEEYGLNAIECVAVGDKMTDLEAAYHAGIEKLYFVPSKYPSYEVPFEYTILNLK